MSLGNLPLVGHPEERGTASTSKAWSSCSEYTPSCLVAWTLVVFVHFSLLRSSAGGGWQVFDYRDTTWTRLTPSLPQPVKFPGWMTQGRACKQYIFRSFNVCFQCSVFWWKSFHMPVRKRTGLKDSNLAFSLAIFKRHHGNEGVNNNTDNGNL